MASFVETATLRVEDQSTAQIKKINDALKKLQKTISALKGKTVDIKVNAAVKQLDKNLTSAAKAPKQLTQNLVKAEKAEKNVTKAARELNKEMRSRAKLDAQRDRTLKETVRAQERAQKKEQQALKQTAAAETKKADQQKRSLEKLLKVAEQAETKKATQQQRAAAKQTRDEDKKAAQQQRTMAKLLKVAEQAEVQKEKAAKKAVKEAEKAETARAKAATKAQNEIEAAARRENTAQEKRARIDRAEARRQEREDAKPTRLGRIGTAAGRATRALGAGAIGLTGYGGTLQGLAAATGRKIQVGAVGADIGETKLRLKQLGEGPGSRRELADKEIQAIEDRMRGKPGGQFHTKGDIQDLYSEVLGVIREGAVAGQTRARDPVTGRQTGRVFTEAERKANLQAAHQSAGLLTEEAKELELHLFALGKPLAEARKGSLAYVKALEMQNVLTDPATGAFSPERAKTAFNFVHRLIDTIGEEATGEFYRQNIRYLKSSKFGLSQDDMQGIALASFAGEEHKTSAAVGIHQMIKQGTGVGIQESAKLMQVELGLMVPKWGAVIKKGKRKGQRQLLGVESVDPEMMRKDPLGFMEKYTAPALEKRFRAELEKGTKAAKGKKAVPGLKGAELDAAVVQAMQNPDKVAALMNKMYSHSSAAAMAGDIFLRMPEYRQLWEDFLSRDPSKTRGAASQSVRVITQSLSNQFEGMLGQAVKAGAPLLFPMIEATSGAMAQLSDTIDKAGKGDPEAKRLLMGGGLVTSILGAPAMKMATGIIGPVLSAIAPTMGMTAGLIGAATAQDPTTRSLAFSGLALSAAAESLTSAATALLAAAAAQSGKGMGFLENLASKGGVVGLAASAALAILNNRLTPTEMENMPYEVQRGVAMQRVITALDAEKRAWEEREGQIARGRPQDRKPGAQERIDAERKANLDRMLRLEDELNRLKVPGAPIHRTIRPPEHLQPTVKVDDDDPLKVEPTTPWVRPPERLQPTVPMPPWRRPPEHLQPTVKEPIPMPRARPPDWLSDFQSSIELVTDVPAKFNSAFSDASSTLLSAGTDAGTNFSSTATSGLIPGASAAGAALASAAVEGIRAGVSNINITANVNVKESKKQGTHTEVA